MARRGQHCGFSLLLSYFTSVVDWSCQTSDVWRQDAWCDCRCKQDDKDVCSVPVSVHVYLCMCVCVLSLCVCQCATSDAKLSHSLPSLCTCKPQLIISNFISETIHLSPRGTMWWNLKRPLAKVHQWWTIRCGSPKGCYWRNLPKMGCEFSSPNIVLENQSGSTMAWILEIPVVVVHLSLMFATRCYSKS